MLRRGWIDAVIFMKECVLNQGRLCEGVFDWGKATLYSRMTHVPSFVLNRQQSYQSLDYKRDDSNVLSITGKNAWTSRNCASEIITRKE